MGSGSPRFGKVLVIGALAVAGAALVIGGIWMATAGRDEPTATRAEDERRAVVQLEEARREAEAAAVASQERARLAEEAAIAAAEAEERARQLAAQESQQTTKTARPHRGQLRENSGPVLRTNL